MSLQGLKIKLPVLFFTNRRVRESNLEHSISLNLLFAIYLVIVFIGYMVEVWRFLNSYNIALAILITPIIAFLVILILSSQFSTVSLYFPKLNIVDVLVIFLLLGYFILKLPFPDLSFDTRNYHVYLQQKSFTELFGKNFLPGGITSAFYSLADSLFYITRTVLGYRLGTILNLFVLYVVYFGMKDIFNIILGNESSEVPISNSKNIILLSSGLAFLSVSCEYILTNLSIYMIDLIFLPLLLEVFRFSIYKTIKPSELNLCSILIGLSIAEKLTNIIFGIPLLFILLLKNQHIWTIKRSMVMMTGVILPMGIYMIFNFSSTANPVFPIFNEVFKSPFYPPQNSKDLRWGPKSLLEASYYPMVLLNDRTRVSEFGFYSGRLAIGWLFTAVIFGLTLLNKKIRSESLIPFFYLIMIYLWIISTGYIRYAEFLELLSIPVIIFGSINLSKVYRDDMVKTFLGIFIILISYQSITAHKIILIDNLDWSERPGLISYISQGKFREFSKLYFLNSKLILMDRFPYLDDKDLEVVAKIDSWYIPTLSSGFSSLLKREIPFLGGDIYFLNEEFKEKRRNSLAQHQSLYTVMDSFSLPFSIVPINQAGLSITDVKFIYPSFIMNGHPLILFQLTNKGHLNSYVNLNSYETYRIPLDKTSSSFDAIFFQTVFQTPYKSSSNPIVLNIIQGEHKFDWIVNKRDIIKIHIELPKRDGEQQYLEFKVSGKDNPSTVPAYGTLINPELK